MGKGKIQAGLLAAVLVAVQPRHGRGASADSALRRPCPSAGRRTDRVAKRNSGAALERIKNRRQRRKQSIRRGNNHFTSQFSLLPPVLFFSSDPPHLAKFPREKNIMMALSRTRPMKSIRLTMLVLAASALLLPSCEWDGNFTVLGYTTKPQSPTNIHTVYVPIFKNLTLWRGIEFDLTRAVIREIEAKTPYKVVSNPDCADTELKCTIVSLNKNVINRNQLNEIREAETTPAVDIIWKNNRTGEILSRPRAPRIANAII